MISPIKSNYSYNYNISYKYRKMPNFRGVSAISDTFYSSPKKLKLDFDTNFNAFRTILKNLPKAKGIWESDYDGRRRYYTTERTIKSPEGYTDGIYNCIAMMLSNGKNAYLLHLCPQNYLTFNEKSTLRNDIKSYIHDLKKIAPPHIEAWLVGGNSYARLGSYNLRETLGKNLKENGVTDIKEILFKESEASSLYYNLKTGQIIIDDGFFEDMEELKTDFEFVSDNLKN